MKRCFGGMHWPLFSTVCISPRRAVSYILLVGLHDYVVATLLRGFILDPSQFTLHFAYPSGQYPPIRRGEHAASKVDWDHVTYGIEDYVALMVSDVIVPTH